MVRITDGSSNTIMVGHGYILTTDYSNGATVVGSCSIFSGGQIGTARSSTAATGAGPLSTTAATVGITFLRDATTPVSNLGAWGGPFPQGGMMAMGDATVRMFPYNTFLGPFLTPTGNETVTIPDT